MKTFLSTQYKTSFPLIQAGEALIATMLCLIMTGCGTASQLVYDNQQFERGSHSYSEALSRDKQACSNHAFKEGIRIAGVTYYEYESAKQAYKDYWFEYQRGILNAPKARHQDQYDYMVSRRVQCMKNRGWYRITI